MEKKDKIMSLPKITNINNNMLRWAREQSINDLHEVIDKNYVEKILKWENAIEYPNYSELKELAILYRKPMAIFFFPEPPTIKDLKTSFRTYSENIKDILSVNMLKMLDYGRIMQLNLIELYDNKNNNISKFTTIKNSNMTTMEIRKFIGITVEQQQYAKSNQDMFNIWRDALYNIGIYVYKNAFKDETVSGICIYDDEFPVILINNSTSLTRQCFTLLHELCHLLKSTSGIDFRNDDNIAEYIRQDWKQVEYYCNQFAGDFLVPEENLENDIKEKTIDNMLISKLALKYRVSREVINRRLYDTKYISFQMFQENAINFSQEYHRIKQNKNGGNYYSTISSYLGQKYLERVYSKYYAKQITAEQLSKYLNMPITNVSKLADIKNWGAI
jgi:Zn-dependent peptidase ImmA (M78 family)